MADDKRENEVKIEDLPAKPATPGEDQNVTGGAYSLPRFGDKSDPNFEAPTKTSASEEPVIGPNG